MSGSGGRYNTFLLILSVRETGRRCVYACVHVRVWCSRVLCGSGGLARHVYSHNTPRMQEISRFTLALLGCWTPERGERGEKYGSNEKPKPNRGISCIALHCILSGTWVSGKFERHHCTPLIPRDGYDLFWIQRRRNLSFSAKQRDYVNACLLALSMRL